MLQPLVRILTRQSCSETLSGRYRKTVQFPTGIRVQFASESASRFNRNRCPVWPGISDQFDPEYVVERIQLVKVHIRPVVVARVKGETHRLFRRATDSPQEHLIVGAVVLVAAAARTEHPGSGRRWNLSENIHD